MQARGLQGRYNDKPGFIASTIGCSLSVCFTNTVIDAFKTLKYTLIINHEDEDVYEDELESIV